MINKDIWWIFKLACDFLFCISLTATTLMIFIFLIWFSLDSEKINYNLVNRIIEFWWSNQIIKKKKLIRLKNIYLINYNFDLDCLY